MGTYADRGGVDVRGGSPAKGGERSAARESNAPARHAGRGVPRAFLLAAAGTLAVAVGYAFAPSQDDELIAATGRVQQRAPAAASAAAPAAPLPVGARTDMSLSANGDPFTAASFVPPPPPAPVVVPPPPPPPKAPPLPFRFIGLVESGAGKPAAFLAQGDALLIVSAGETVDNKYRIESLSPNEVVLTYLPLQERQTLGLSGATP